MENERYDYSPIITRKPFKLPNQAKIAVWVVPNIEYFDMPDTLKDKYQYFTEADMKKLISAGYPYKPKTLEMGIQLYHEWYLKHGF